MCYHQIYLLISINLFVFKSIHREALLLLFFVFLFVNKAIYWPTCKAATVAFSRAVTARESFCLFWLAFDGCLVLTLVMVFPFFGRGFCRGLPFPLVVFSSLFSFCAFLFCCFWYFRLTFWAKVGCRPYSGKKFNKKWWLKKQFQAMSQVPLYNMIPYDTL